MSRVTEDWFRLHFRHLLSFYYEQYLVRSRGEKNAHRCKILMVGHLGHWERVKNSLDSLGDITLSDFRHPKVLIFNVFP